jgi:hypothetical protein
LAIFIVLGCSFNQNFSPKLKRSTQWGEGTGGLGWVIGKDAYGRELALKAICVILSFLCCKVKA